MFCQPGCPRLATKSDDRLQYLLINLPPQLPPLLAPDLGLVFCEIAVSVGEARARARWQAMLLAAATGEGLQGRASARVHHPQREATAKPLRVGDACQVHRAGRDQQEHLTAHITPCVRYRPLPRDGEDSPCAEGAGARQSIGNNGLCPHLRRGSGESAQILSSSDGGGGISSYLIGITDEPINDVNDPTSA